MKKTIVFLLLFSLFLFVACKSNKNEHEIKNAVNVYVQGVRKCNTSMLKSIVAHKWLREYAPVQLNSAIKGLCNMLPKGEVVFKKLQVEGDSNAKVTVQIGSTIKVFNLIKEKRGWMVVPPKIPLRVREIHHRFRVTNLKISPKLIPVPTKPILKIRPPVPSKGTK